MPPQQKPWKRLLKGSRKAIEALPAFQAMADISFSFLSYFYWPVYRHAYTGDRKIPVPGDSFFPDCQALFL